MNTQQAADCNNSKLNQSIVSENNRYSKYLDEEDVEVQIVDRSQLRNLQNLQLSENKFTGADPPDIPRAEAN